jgi:Uma2 family endonuclease
MCGLENLKGMQMDAHRLFGDGSLSGVKRKRSAGEGISRQNLIRQLVLAQATDLARAGCYTEAEDVLTQLLDEQGLPLALDLRARMCAQQGKLREAREFWKRALQLDPTNGAYVAGLLRLSLYRSHRWWPLPNLFSSRSTRVATAVSHHELLMAHLQGGRWHYEIVPSYMVRNRARGGGYDDLLLRLARQLAGHVETHNLGIITLSQAGYDITLPGEQNTVWVPDMAFVRSEHIPAADSPAWYSPWKVVPDLVVEIIASPQEQQEMEQLVQGWLQRGVRMLWIIRPASEAIDVWLPDADKPTILGMKESLDGLDIIPGFACRLEQVFSVSRQ